MDAPLFQFARSPAHENWQGSARLVGQCFHHRPRVNARACRLKRQVAITTVFGRAASLRQIDAGINR